MVPHRWSLLCLAFLVPLSPALGTPQRVLVLRGGFSPLQLPLQAAAQYNKVLSTAPLTTNIVTAAALATLSDGIAQTMERRSHGGSWDVERSAWMIVWGGAVSGCFIFFWLRWLGFLFPLARTSLRQLISKVGFNQLFMSPGLNSAFFAFVILTRTPPKLRMPAEKRAMLLAKYRSDLLTTCLRSCYFWSVVQMVNFRFLPARYGGACARYEPTWRYPQFTRKGVPSPDPAHRVCQFSGPTLHLSSGPLIFL